jgi:hypothetical protein
MVDRFPVLPGASKSKSYLGHEPVLPSTGVMPFQIPKRDITHAAD